MAMKYKCYQVMAQVKPPKIIKTKSGSQIQYYVK